MKNKKYLYDIEIVIENSLPTGIITNRQTKQYGCVIHKSDLNNIRNWIQFEDSDFYFDLKWIPKYMIKEVIKQLKPYFNDNDL